MSARTEKIQLGGLVDMLGVELRIAQILADRVFSQCVDSPLAPGHYTILSIVYQNPGINQSALARCMYMDRSSMVPILDQFENKGWLHRKSRPQDRRSYALELSPAGQRVLHDAESKVLQLETVISGIMGKQEAADLLNGVKQLQQALHSLSAGSAGGGA